MLKFVYRIKAGQIPQYGDQVQNTRLRLWVIADNAIEAVEKAVKHAEPTRLVIEQVTLVCEAVL